MTVQRLTSAIASEHAAVCGETRFGYLVSVTHPDTAPASPPSFLACFAFDGVRRELERFCEHVVASRAGASDVPVSVDEYLSPVSALHDVALIEALVGGPQTA